MSSGRLPAPSSAIVVPTTFVPLEAVHRELHERRAGVARDDVRLAVDRVGDEGVDRRAGLERAVVAVEDLHAGARVGRDEGIREGAQLRRELLVGEAGDDQLAAHERHVGHRVGARVAAAGRRVGRRVRAAPPWYRPASRSRSAGSCRRRRRAAAPAWRRRPCRASPRCRRSASSGWMTRSVTAIDAALGAEQRRDLRRRCAATSAAPALPPLACAPRSSA